MQGSGPDAPSCVRPGAQAHVLPSHPGRRLRENNDRRGRASRPRGQGDTHAQRDRRGRERAGDGEGESSQHTAPPLVPGNTAAPALGWASPWVGSAKDRSLCVVGRTCKRGQISDSLAPRHESRTLVAVTAAGFRRRVGCVPRCRRTGGARWRRLHEQLVAVWPCPRCRCVRGWSARCGPSGRPQRRARRFGPPSDACWVGRDAVRRGRDCIPALSIPRHTGRGLLCARLMTFVGHES